jgi:hypothetical protein
MLNTIYKTVLYFFLTFQNIHRHAVASMTSGIGDVGIAPLYTSDGKILANFIAVEAMPLQQRRVKRTDSNMAEQLSKNVTKILEGLLKDYDKTERPSYKSGMIDI